MAIWDLQDKRYKGARGLLIASIVGLVLAGIGLFLLFSFGSRDSKPRASGTRVPSPTTEPAAKMEPTPAPGPDVALTPASPPSQEEIRQEKLQTLRSEMSRARDWDTIEPLARGILDLEPEDGEAWSYLGRFYEAKGNEKQAMEAYENAVSSPTKTYYYFYVKALLHRKQGDFPSAIANLEEARQLKTDSVGLSNLLLIFRIQAGQVEDVRSVVRGYANTEIQANADQWLLGAAALSMQDGDKTAAVGLLTRFRNLVHPEMYELLMGDSFFDSYRTDVNFLPFFLKAGSGSQ